MTDSSAALQDVVEEFSESRYQCAAEKHIRWHVDGSRNAVVSVGTPDDEGTADDTVEDDRHVAAYETADGGIARMHVSIYLAVEGVVDA